MKTANTTRFYYKNNIIQQLRGFYHVAQLGSVTKAGEKMGLVQSAISLQIKNLQDDLGVKLFENKNGRLELTPTGKSFYNKIFPIVEQTDNLLKEFWQGYEEEGKNELKLGVHSVVASHLLPNAIFKLKQELPETKVKLSHIPKLEAFERLIKDELDLAIYPCSIYEEFPIEIKATPFLDYNICIIVPKQNPLALMEDREITLNELIKHKLLYEDEKLMTSSKLIKTFKENNIKSEIEFENVSWEVMSKFCIAEIGIAGFDELYLKNLNAENVVVKSISHLFPKMSYFFLTRKNKSLEKNVILLMKNIANI